MERFDPNRASVRSQRTVQTSSRKKYKEPQGQRVGPKYEHNQFWRALWLVLVLAATFFIFFAYLHTEWVITQPQIEPRREIGIVRQCVGSSCGEIAFDDIAHPAWKATAVLVGYSLGLLLIELVAIILSFRYFVNNRRVLNSIKACGLISSIILFAAMLVWPIGLENDKVTPCVNGVLPEAYYMCDPYDLGWGVYFMIIGMCLLSFSICFSTIVSSKPMPPKSQKTLETWVDRRERSSAPREEQKQEQAPPPQDDSMGQFIPMNTMYFAPQQKPARKPRQSQESIAPPTQPYLDVQEQPPEEEAKAGMVVCDNFTSNPFRPRLCQACQHPLAEHEKLKAEKEERTRKRREELRKREEEAAATAAAAAAAEEDDSAGMIGFSGDAFAQDFVAQELAAGYLETEQHQRQQPSVDLSALGFDAGYLEAEQNQPPIDLTALGFGDFAASGYLEPEPHQPSQTHQQNQPPIDLSALGFDAGYLEPEQNQPPIDLTALGFGDPAQPSFGGGGIDLSQFGSFEMSTFALPGATDTMGSQRSRRSQRGNFTINPIYNDDEHKF